MSVSVDQVVSEFIAKVQGYEQDVKRAVAVVDSHTAAIERNNRAEAKAETDTSATRKRRTSAEAQAAREQAAIQKQAAKEIADAEKAAAKAASDAVKASAREQAAAVKSAEREKQAAIKATAQASADAITAERRRQDEQTRNTLRSQSAAARGEFQPPKLTAAQEAEYVAGRNAALARAGTTFSDGGISPRSAPGAGSSKAAVADEREINHVLADRATYQAGLVASTREETILIRDQLRS